MSTKCPIGIVDISLEILTKPDNMTCLCPPGTGTREEEEEEKKEQQENPPSSP